PYQQKRHGRCEWSKVWVVYRGPVVALVKGAHHQPMVRIGWNANLLQDTTKENRFVVGVVAIDGLGGQKKSLVALNELDDIWRFPAGAPLSGKPKRIMFPGHRHEVAHRPGAAEVLVRLGHKSLDPVCNGAKCTAIVFGEFPGPAGVLEILKEE